MKLSSPVTLELAALILGTLHVKTVNRLQMEAETLFQDSQPKNNESYIRGFFRQRIYTCKHCPKEKD